MCQSFHSELVSIDDAEENLLLRKIVANIRGMLTKQIALIPVRKNDINSPAVAYHMFRNFNYHFISFC